MDEHDVAFVQAWQHWCERNASHLPLPIKRFSHKKNGEVLLRFDGAHPALRFWACGIELGVEVVVRGKNGSIQHSIAAACEMGAGRYGFGIDGNLAGRNYDSVEEFWEDVFSAWCAAVDHILWPGTWLVHLPDQGWRIRKILWSSTDRKFLAERVRALNFDHAFRTCIEPGLDWLARQPHGYAFRTCNGEIALTLAQARGTTIA